MDGQRYIQRGISFRDDPPPQPRVRAPRVYTNRRKVSDDDVRVIRHDAQLRRRAVEMLKLAKDALRTIPSSEDHGRRLGIAGANVRVIARGKTYKDVR